MSTIKAVLRTDKKADEKDEYSIALRLYCSVDQKITYPYTFPFRCMKRSWNKSTSQISEFYKDRPQWNSLIRDSLRRAQEIIDDHPEVSSALLREKISNRLENQKNKYSPKTCLFAFAEEYIEQKYIRKNKISTAKQYESIINACKLFFGESMLYDNLNPEIIDNWLEWLEYEKPRRNNKDHGLSRNTVINHFQKIHHLYKQSNKKYRHSTAYDPFSHVELEREQTEVEGLNKDQIKQISELDLNDDPTSHHIRNMFLFSIYSGGIRVSDVLKLKWKEVHIDSAELWFTPYKTRDKKVGKMKNPLHPKAIEILNEYKKSITGVDEFVFPFGNEYDVNTENDEEFFLYLRKMYPKIHRSMKKIKELTDLSIDLHFHISRHTVAHLVQEAGMSAEKIKDLLGHSNLAITQKYLSRIEAVDNTDKKEEYFKAIDAS